jgi:hypothetical protein
MFQFENLDQRTREYMLLEVEAAIKTSQLYTSKRFTEAGRALYPRLLREAVAHGSEETLAIALLQQGCIQTREKHGAGTRKVPTTAARTFAEGEFNAFYMRGICHRAIREGYAVEVYRAKSSGVPRRASELIEGNLENPQRLLLYLKNSIDGSQRGSQLPAGSNSGLTLRLTNIPVSK